MPSYKELFEQIGSHLSARRKALIWRSVMLTSPALFFIALYLLADWYVPWLESLPRSLAQFIALTVIMLCVAFGAVFRFIFEIEKRIWVDSYFDGEPLTLGESWGIATKLFVPGIIFQIKIWFHYYAIPTLLFFLSAGLLIALDDARIGIVGLFVSLVTLSIYTYYLRVRLRYTWFYFLDNYGVSEMMSVGQVASGINQLNEVMKGEAFKKSLVVMFGTDAVNAVANVAISSVEKGVGSLGSGMAVVGTIAGVVGREISRQVTDYGNIAAQYALYRIARKEITGKEQEVNHFIYDLR